MKKTLYVCQLLDCREQQDRYIMNKSGTVIFFFAKDLYQKDGREAQLLSRHNVSHKYHNLHFQGSEARITASVLKQDPNTWKVQKETLFIRIKHQSKFRPIAAMDG